MVATPRSGGAERMMPLMPDARLSWFTGRLDVSGDLRGWPEQEAAARATSAAMGTSFGCRRRVGARGWWRRWVLEGSRVRRAMASASATAAPSRKGRGAEPVGQQTADRWAGQDADPDGRQGDAHGRAALLLRLGPVVLPTSARRGGACSAYSSPGLAYR